VISEIPSVAREPTAMKIRREKGRFEKMALKRQITAAIFRVANRVPSLALGITENYCGKNVRVR
jgi:hypothetical protein